MKARREVMEVADELDLHIEHGDRGKWRLVSAWHDTDRPF